MFYFRTSEFLSHLQTVAENHHFFQKGYSPSEMDDLPDTFRSIIDNTADIHDTFHNSKSRSFYSSKSRLCKRSNDIEYF